MVVIGILMMIYVMPSITGTFKNMGVELPVMTQILITTSDFMVAHTFVVLVGMVLTVVGFIYALRTRVGKILFHGLILHLPVIGTMVKETNSARTARTLSSLLTSGVDMIRALTITEDVVQNVGEETGQISQMLSQLAEFYEGEVEQKTKDLSTIIEPVLMVFIGGTVGFFALAMISPIYSISDSIG